MSKYAAQPLPWSENDDVVDRQAVKLVRLGFDGAQRQLAEVDVETGILPGGVLECLGVEVAVDELERIQGVHADIQQHCLVGEDVVVDHLPLVVEDVAGRRANALRPDRDLILAGQWGTRRSVFK